MNGDLSAAEGGASPEEHVEWDTEDLAQQVWDDLAGRIPRSIIRCTISRLLAKYDDAAIRRYVPLLVRREARELLSTTAIKEIEAKFTVPDPCIFWQLQMSKRLAGYALSPLGTTDAWDTYLDTEQRHILAGGHSCRRRETSEGLVMNLKSIERPVKAVHRRQEWQVKLTGIQQPIKWPDSPVRDRVLKLIGQEPLLPLFDLQQTRTIRMVRQEGQPVAELSLDSVTLDTGRGQHFYRELEVELLPFTSEEVLAAIATYLESEWNLRPEPRSKFERALALLDSATTGKEVEPTSPG